MGKKKKRLSKKQLQQNMILSLFMLIASIIVLVAGIFLIRGITSPEAETSREESRVIQIPGMKDDSSREESSTAGETSAQQVTGDPIPAVSAPEESSIEESSTEESSEEESSEEESSKEESSQEESSMPETSGEESSGGTQSTEAGNWKTVTDDYFADAAFVGNSLTEGLFFYTDIGDIADGYYSTGLNVLNAQTDAFVDGVYTLNDVLLANSYRKVYVMMGINEVGWPSIESFIGEYEKMLRQIENDCPNAIIYVQSILPVSAARSAQGDSINNPNILSFNAEIQKMAERNGWTYLNVWDAIANEDGVLDADATPDGIHFGTVYMEDWLDYLRTHAVSE